MAINLPKRKSIRLKQYDYASAGWYYVTICTQNRECIFGEIVDGGLILNQAGEMVNRWLVKIPERFANIQLDEFQIMPNHIHAIIVIRHGRTHGSAPTIRSSPVGVDPRVDPNRGRSQQLLFRTIRWFKTMTTNEYIRGIKSHGWPVFEKRIWQRNYYEHIIRTEDDLEKIRGYIRNNPAIWYRDRNNPEAVL